MSGHAQAEWLAEFLRRFAAPPQLLVALRNARRPLIACHEDPDPDCIGSMLALGQGLARLGARPCLVSTDPLPWALSQLPGADRILSPERLAEAAAEGVGAWDTAIVLDCEPARTGKAWPFIQLAPVLVNVDHHETNRSGPGIRWVEPGAAATGELVFALLHSLSVELDASMASNLFAALQGDTGSFQFENTSAHTLRIAAHLVERGASPGELSRVLYENREFSYVQLLGEVIRTLQRNSDGRIAWVYLTREMIARSGLPASEVEGFVRYPRMIRGVEVALLFRESEDGRIRVSLRSRGRVNVAELASRLGGGGHTRASGCTLEGDLQTAMTRVLAETERAVAQALARDIDR
ncbi:MAG: bifunctional oligoribonuclease/PAP phosphatase NrnA [Limnochordales bacterium]|nr:bifunctional oligoribonuclease/PAP phosphatase NrnA [Limnochordales bacterium]